MLSLPCSASIRTSSSRRSISLYRRHHNPRLAAPRLLCSSTLPADSTAGDHLPQRAHRGNNAGLRLEETVDEGSEKSRLDAWITSRVPGVSRARIQSSIRQGLVCVNGRAVDKVSHVVKGGDKVICTVSELQPLSAVPEDIPLDIVYEDDHVLVVNKPAHMVVHPAPGNPHGTLVNAILHHCSLPTISYANHELLSDIEDDSELHENELDGIYAFKNSNLEASVRPGIVHRLDKGTSGLLVVAKDGHSHAHLAEQFKCHTIRRVYISLTAGVPSTSSARIEVPIARDPNNRLRMAAVSGNKARNSRSAASIGYLRFLPMGVLH